MWIFWKNNCNGSDNHDIAELSPVLKYSVSMTFVPALA